MTVQRSPVEKLFAALAEPAWSVVLECVHTIRHDSDAVSGKARHLVAETLSARIRDLPSELSDEVLERALLLDRAGFLPLPEETLDMMAEGLVNRHLSNPARAVRFARFRPEADACRGVLSQFEAAGATRTEDLHGGRITRVEAASRVDGRRAIFRSRQESVLYQAARRLFPASILVPNAALHAAVSFESIQGLLSASESDLFFRVLIDLVVFQADEPWQATHFIELDSPWHDDPGARSRDRVKERMLGLAGCELLRIRPPGTATLPEMLRILQASVATRDAPSASEHV
ncbi:MAG: DUF2726 domain-containing protein [Rhodothermales bacterium]|nr:DUF2726 domain-containing protein [Rhodothermales bacterium]